MEYLTDIEIAQRCEMQPISEVARTAHVEERYLEHYGRYKAKVDLSLLRDAAEKENGKLILVTAITPTPAGEGKTTTTIGLADGLKRIGKDVTVALRDLDVRTVCHVFLLMRLAPSFFVYPLKYRTAASKRRMS